MHALALAVLMAIASFGQSNTGELRLRVTDASGLPLQAAVELVNEVNQFQESLTTDSTGLLIARRLPFATYRMTVALEGFSTFVSIVDVQSALPTEYRVTLSVAPLQTQVTVTPDDTLLDPRQTMTVNRIGAVTLRQRTMALPGRSLPELVNTQPGWLLEANGVLHPRGSEYQTQYVIDGLPLTDNRSPAFAPEIDADNVRAMSILTGGYPAEYGRKLGGVIEVVTAGQPTRGFHGSVSAAAGSFATKSGDALGAYGGNRWLFTATGGIAGTDRYLDPPVLENESNHGRAVRTAIHFEGDFTDADRLGMIVRHGRTHFLVPNEHVQAEAGQRQDRDSEETTVQFSFQHILSKGALAEVRGLARDLSAGLQSNTRSTPIVAQQDRGLRELYVKATVSGRAGMHEWKAGGDVSLGRIRERFQYQISDFSQFDPETPPGFAFSGARSDLEHAVFAQEQMRLGAWTINAGVRWDRYRLVVEDSAFSPRLSVAWTSAVARLVLRASYDRAFQTPAIENLLLASSADVVGLNENILRLPIRPSRGDFYEGGLSKSLFGTMRLDVSHFVRTMTNFADDDLLLNTGVSFPIAFSSARIAGTEMKLEMPQWKRISGSFNYANMHGIGKLPITGGLFLGEEARDLLGSTGQFQISQDQRHTLRGRLSYQATQSIWAAAGISYGSGLPVEFSEDRQHALAQYGARIVDRVDFDAGRLRPSVSMDTSVGVVLARRDTRDLRIQADVRNLTNHLNVINFAGLFSGTAIAAPRSISVRLQATF